MEIREDEDICEVRAVALRDAFLWLTDRTFIAEAVGDLIGLDQAGSQALFRRLLAEGYVRRHSGTGLVFYVMTDKAEQLAGATVAD